MFPKQSRSLFSRPRTIADALDLLADPNTVVLSGGTDFYPQRLNRSRVGQPHEHIVDITAIDEMRGISETATGWRIGAATTWTGVADADLPTMFDGLRSAARQIGGTQIQNVGTIAGNLCTASPAADGVPPLLTLNPIVELCSLTGTRNIPLAEFIMGYRSTGLRPGELVVAVEIPTISRFVQARNPAVGLRASTNTTNAGDVRSSFVKLGSRAYLVISIAMVAVLLVIDDGTIDSARIAIGSCSPVAHRMTALETSLAGAPIDDRRAVAGIVRGADLDGLAPIDDVRGSGDYRLAVVPQLIIDAIAACRTPIAAGARS